MLDKQGKLLRNYTQNIDTLEQVAGVQRIIQCHGKCLNIACYSHAALFVLVKVAHASCNTKKIRRCWRGQLPNVFLLSLTKQLRYYFI